MILAFTLAFADIQSQLGGLNMNFATCADLAVAY